MKDPQRTTTIILEALKQSGQRALSIWVGVVWEINPYLMMFSGSIMLLHDYAVHLKTNDPTNPDLVLHVMSDWGP